MPGYEPTAEDLASVQAWFATYDKLADARDYEAMADLAVFPLNGVTDDGKGNGSATQTSRAEYLEQMAHVMGGDDDVKLETTRTPHFLSDALVFVISDGTMTYAGETTPIRYGDLLLKTEGGWKFQTMAQGGWA
ncbi:nuclear transport factor 2 family protein [Kribbella sp. NPDC051770]|uniref:nuclear transport factor 2 family protein n=1 Tax=Kribbella sp. NPDC051770 TaxID=3155413 RepID=UPI00341A7550